MNTPLLISLFILALVGCLIFVLFFRQLREILMLFLNTAVGWAVLYIFNIVFSGVGISIGVNIASASIVGVLGLPGLILMIILNALYK